MAFRAAKAMGVKWALRFLILSFPPYFLHAQYRSNNTANLSTTWTNNGWISHFLDGSIVQNILFNNRNMRLPPAMACGFFGNGTGDSFYFITFATTTSSGPATYSGSTRPLVLWYANRDNPVNENATLELTSDGDLVLRHADGAFVWSTNTSVF